MLKLLPFFLADRRQLPTSYLEGDGQNLLPEVAPPVFTYETRTSLHHHQLQTGDTFKVSCQALGSPQPEIFWFKDGQHIDENVHYQRGKSTVEFSVLGTADSGVYTCRASNLVGESTTNFTLEVKPPVGSHQAIVTEAGPSNTTVAVGETATLKCRVKSLAQPHIKWLKRLEKHDASSEKTLKVADERYKILDTNQEVATNKNEYLSKLTLRNVQTGDSGMYICFVTNSGFAALTYDSMNLRVIEKPVTVFNNNDIGEDYSTPASSNPDANPVILSIVIGLALCVLVVLFVIVVCVMKKRRKLSAPDSPEVQRPFVTKTNMPPPPPSLPNNNKFHLHYNGSTIPVPSVYPESDQMKQQQFLLLSSDSGFDNGSNGQTAASGANGANCKNLLDSSLNQYEVPYSHLLPKQNNNFRVVNNDNDFYRHQQQPQQYHHPGYIQQPFRNFKRPLPQPQQHQQHLLQQHLRRNSQQLPPQQYLSDYESQ